MNEVKMTPEESQQEVVNTTERLHKFLCEQSVPHTITLVLEDESGEKHPETKSWELRRPLKHKCSGAGIGSVLKSILDDFKEFEKDEKKFEEDVEKVTPEEPTPEVPQPTDPAVVEPEDLPEVEEEPKQPERNYWQGPKQEQE